MKLRPNKKQKKATEQNENQGQESLELGEHDQRTVRQLQTGHEVLNRREEELITEGGQPQRRERQGNIREGDQQEISKEEEEQQEHVRDEYGRKQPGSIVEDTAPAGTIQQSSQMQPTGGKRSASPETSCKSSQIQPSQVGPSTSSSSMVGFPGGPLDPCVLKYFEGHVARSIWKTKYRAALKVQWSSRAMLTWNLNDECPRFQEKVKDSGLKWVIQGTYSYANRALISALVERWHPETNTFHFPCGEMTVTLDDVVHLTGLKAVGKAFLGEKTTLNQDKSHKAIKLLVNGLGYKEDEAKTLLAGNRGCTIKFSQLRDRFAKKCNNNDEDKVIDYHVRAFLLYFLSTLLLSDKSGGLAHVSYLDALMDVSEIKKYSFATAVLAYLYRQLGSASRAATAQIAGYCTLLEAWVYEHFSTGIGDVKINPKYTNEMPLMYKWQPNKPPNPTLEQVKAIRVKFDDLSAEDVIWQPYNREKRQLVGMSFYKGVLVCFDVFEPHNPDRVLRQFGRLQIIPGPPIAMEAKSRLGEDYEPVYKGDIELFKSFQLDWTNHTLCEESMGVDLQEQGLKPYACGKEWFKWYKKITHEKVQNPHRRGDDDGLDNLGIWKKGVNDALCKLRQGLVMNPLVLKENVQCVIESLSSLPDIDEDPLNDEEHYIDQN